MILFIRFIISKNTLQNFIIFIFYLFNILFKYNLFQISQSRIVFIRAQIQSEYKFASFSNIRLAINISIDSFNHLLAISQSKTHSCIFVMLWAFSFSKKFEDISLLFWRYPLTCVFNYKFNLFICKLFMLLNCDLIW